jgi:RimJ/RimL family protein N-acetyltransferase
LNPNIIIRKADVSDAEQIIAHTKKVLMESSHFLGTSVEEFQPTLEEEKDWIQHHQQHGLLLVAEVEKTIIGMLNFRLSTSKKFCHQGMFGMSIQEAYTNQKIGRELLQQLIDWARQDPRVEKISLEVFSNNERAIHLYTQLGFIVEGRRVKNAKIAPGIYVDDIMMSMFV